MTGFGVTMATHSGCYIVKMFAYLIEVERFILIVAALWVQVVGSSLMNKNKRSLLKVSVHLSLFPDCGLGVTHCLESLLSSLPPVSQTEANRTQHDRKQTQRGWVLGRWAKTNNMEKWIDEFWDEGAKGWPCGYLWRERMSGKDSQWETADYLRTSTWARWLQPRDLWEPQRCWGIRTGVQSCHTLKTPFCNWVMRMGCWVLNAHSRQLHLHSWAPPKS